jgi:hypothetical protein
MKKLLIAPIVASPWLLALGGPVAADSSLLRAKLDGFGQVPPVITTGMGKFQARINPDKTISYTLQYSQLMGTGAVNFADIHFGQEQVNGGIIVLLCANVPPEGGVNVPPGTQMCPSGKGSGATLTGKVMAGSIVGPAQQGINPGDWQAALAAIRSGLVYAQVHTVAFTNGEIRGQIEREGKDEDSR